MNITHLNFGEYLPLWSVFPFAGLLLSIAILPYTADKFRKKNTPLIIAFWVLLFCIPFGASFGGHLLTYQLIETVVLDYVPFIVLLFGLYTVAGGIAIKGGIVGTPTTNISLLLIGTALASLIGTTGAAILMIRPILSANAYRKKKAHVVVFFILLAANIGGCLTPIGDPPLYLGFLRGVPFFWTIRLLPILLLNTAVLMIFFAIIDGHFYKKEVEAGNLPLAFANVGFGNDCNGFGKRTVETVKNAGGGRITIDGAHNFFLLLLIVGAVILSGILPSYPAFADPATGTLYGLPLFEDIVLPYTTLIEILLILTAAAISLRTTKWETRAFNDFNFEPIADVAKLFIGIFITMIPALALLRSNGAALGITEPAQFFWITGALSSFLDNAPTYLVFLTMAGSLGIADGLATSAGIIPEAILRAISAGAVFMGALTYIGNAPNLMVKHIAEDRGVKMPSFFGYTGWALCILVPVFLLDTLIFFR